MRKLMVIVAALALSGCASIVSKSDWPVNFQSATPGEKFAVRNDDGALVAEGVTPTVLVLSSREGYFSGADYTVTTARGTTELRSSLNGWYFGNVVFGGLLGLLIVDPATGAMWRMPPVAYVSGSEPPRVVPVSVE